MTIFRRDTCRDSTRIEFIGVDDENQIVMAFDLPAFDLMYVGLDVGFWCVASGLVEENPHVEFFLVGNDKLSLEMLDHLSKRYLQRLDASKNKDCIIDSSKD